MNENDDKPFDVAAFFEHSGVKGMKWGVTNTSSAGTSRQQRQAVKKLKKADKKWLKGIYTTKGAIAVHNNTANEMNNKHLPELNKRPQYKGKNLSANPKLKEQYFKDVLKLQDEAVTRAVKEVHGTSPSGKMKAELAFDSNGAYRIRVKNIPGNVSHAQMDQPFPDDTYVFDLTVDNNGFFTAMDLAPIDLTHSEDAFDVAAFFEHSGVKGMKWGVITKVRASSAEKSTARKVNRANSRALAKAGRNEHRSAANAKIHKMTTQELETAIKRIELERKYSTLTEPAKAQGKRTIRKLLGNIGTKSVNTVGTQLVTNTLNQAVNKGLGGVKGYKKLTPTPSFPAPLPGTMLAR